MAAAETVATTAHGSLSFRLLAVVDSCCIGSGHFPTSEGADHTDVRPLGIGENNEREGK